MKKKKYIIPGIILIIVCLYFICEVYFFTPFTVARLAVWNWEHRNTDQTEILITGKSTLYEKDTSGYERYLNPDEMAISWAKEEEEYLMILGENYSRSYYDHEDGIYSHGPMGFYHGAVIVMVNPGKREVVKEIKISDSDGKVIYMDQTQYVLMKHEKVQFYNIFSGEMIREEIIDDFRRDEIYSVEVSVFGDELRICRDGNVLKKINVSR